MPATKTAISRSVPESSSTKQEGKTMAKKTTKAVGKTATKTKAADKKKSVTAMDTLLKENENLNNAFQQIEKTFGDGAIMSLNNDGVSRIRGISTGSLALDIALGGQGFVIEGW